MLSIIDGNWQVAQPHDLLFPSWVCRRGCVGRLGLRHKCTRTVKKNSNSNWSKFLNQKPIRYLRVCQLCLRQLATKKIPYLSVWSGLLAAVSRIAAILPNDLAPTNMNGPLLPLATAPTCCGAARQCRHSLQARNPMMGELTVCRRSKPYLCVATRLYTTIAPANCDGRWRCDLRIRPNAVLG